MKNSLSLVLPCYNEAPSLSILGARIFESVRKRNLNTDMFQLILVNNGSTDDTPRELSKLKASPIGPYLHVVDVFPNRGYGNGVFRGLCAAKTSLIGWTHADGQTDPEDVFLAWEVFDQQQVVTTLVKGNRLKRTFGARFFSGSFEYLASLLLGRRFHEINAAPKVFPSDLLAKLVTPAMDYTFDLYVLLKAIENGYKIIEIDVLFPTRKYGESKWAATFGSKVKTSMKFIRFMVQYRALSKPSAFSQMPFSRQKR